MEQKTTAKELKEKLFLKRKNTYTEMTDEEICKADEFCEGYKAFLDAGKTEREACAEAIRIAESNGFKPFVKGTRYNAGERVYLNNRG